MQIGLASDHAGFDLKEELKAFLKSLGVKAIDMGNAAFSGDRLETFLGGLPRTSLEAGLKSTVDYFRGAL